MLKKCKIVLLIAALVGIGVMPLAGRTLRVSGEEKSSPVLVVDPGHGEPDSGAVGEDGTRESEITLKIGRQMKSIAGNHGITVILTREKEEGLRQEGKKWTKLGDLQARRRIIEEAGADAVLSIHLNSFPQDRSVQGAQVFYPKGLPEAKKEETEALAEQIQGALNERINRKKKREVLPKGDLYLFENPKVPMILVECGFLSNPEELSLLKQKKYRRKIAETILDGVIQPDSCPEDKEEKGKPVIN